MVIELTKEQASLVHLFLIPRHAGPPCHKRADAAQAPKASSTRGELPKPSAPWLGEGGEDWKLLILTFHSLAWNVTIVFLGHPSRDTRIRRGGQGQKAQRLPFFPLCGDGESRMTCRWPHLKPRGMQRFGKELYLFFFNCKRKKENEKKMLIVAARKYAWENGLYHLFFEVGVEKEMKPGREDPEGWSCEQSAVGTGTQLVPEGETCL